MFGEINMPSLNKDFGWTSFLNKTQSEDPYHVFKEEIAIKSEELISNIAFNLMNSGQNYTYETSKKMAICLMMQEMLNTQHQNAPETQKAMVINLFCELPSTTEFKCDLYKQLKEQHFNQISLKGYLKLLINKWINNFKNKFK